MILTEDKAQKEGKHKIKNDYWTRNKIEVLRYPLPVGDYILGTEKVMDVVSRKEKRNTPVKKMDFLGTYGIAVDSKFSIQELVSDICGKQHERFRDECILAQNNGIRLVILVENEDGITQLSELHKWVNPRLFIRERGGRQKYPNATRGVTLQKCCYTIAKKYGVSFLFCHSAETGEKIIEILENANGKH